MLNIHYIDKYEIYEKGNYVNSFDTKDEVTAFFENEYNIMAWRYPDEDKRKIALSDRSFSVIESKHFFFD